jgi:hypothetical protein
MPAIVVRFALLLASAMPMAAVANTFCCEANGKTYCDDGVPAACYGKAYRQLNNYGAVIKQYAAPLTPEQLAKRDAELARQREEDEKRAEQDRQDRKLVSMYATLTDMDVGHESVLAGMKKGQQQIEQKLADAEKKKKQLANEAEFYKKGQLPIDLKTQIAGNEKDIEAQKKAIAGRAQEIEAAKVRFNEDKQRYLRLTAGNAERQR